MSAKNRDSSLQIGQIIDLTINDYGYEGVGAGRYHGFTVFVPGALYGERIQAKITEIRGNSAQGVLANVLVRSVDRNKPFCRIYGLCGGCNLQHMEYKAQLIMKWQLIVNAIERIAEFKGVLVHPTIGMKKPWFYLNRLHYWVGRSDDNELIMGFGHKDTQEIVTTKECVTQPMIANWISQKLKEIVKIYGFSAYNEADGTGLLRHIMIRIGYYTDEIMVILVTNGAEFPYGERFALELMVNFPAVKSVIQNINVSRDRTIFGKENRVLAGSSRITDKVDDIKFCFSLKSFYRSSPVQTIVLYKEILKYAGLTGTESVLDAYCGIGVLSLMLARKARFVFGIEYLPEAFQDARENVALNNINNVQFILGRTEKVLPELINQGFKFDVAVLDPPRSGCEPSVLKNIANAMIKRVVYVSYNPGTLAHDLKLLSEYGYKIIEIQPVDLRPQTHFVECVAKLERV
ncbi:MAG TPA: 23S rRNA (uracil(1939)-C(5))-methyltransferase RlmD [Bacillota bacterium]|jgi:23S rRNA (uracil1939-C5)-methyltransferase|nr:23S rRNA (uracil(1939)-C(5))-methyltransferase RlmD [Bacillota bacterium]HOL09947.1 23S rRNA (uracil(1939)-C(5))-methyltransferase RlmD [Bacillota bacterium]HPO96813.1 23S rRNA (uracil(1939)-C(5))-methyltransferase RlmD [Bacillota bacterium]